MLSKMWNGIKKFFKDSETIFWARLQAFSGLVIASLAAMNWAPLIALGASAGFTINQILFLSAVLFGQGLVTEIARRLRAKDL